MLQNPDRLSALDATFLEIEDQGAHMHIASVMVFEGETPTWDELCEAIDARLHLVPRYRQRLAQVPLNQGRPVWVDDPHFNIRYHLRHAAVPSPGGDDELKHLAARLFSQRLDRTKPLWELYLVDGLRGGRFAIIAKTHHALVDGISGVDLVTVLFDTSRDPTPVGRPDRPWMRRPVPGRTQLLAAALAERASLPLDVARGVREVARAPRRAARRAGRDLGAIASTAAAVLRPAPATPLTVPIGPHRVYDWISVDLGTLKAIKNELGGTVNDVVLTAVTLALGRWLRRHGGMRDALVLRALVPVSVRADAERGALGNRVAAMYAPLPVFVEDPEECHRRVYEAMAGLKESGQAVGAQLITTLGDFAPPTILHQAARLESRSRWFNLVVTNVPGPQIPLYVLGRRLERLYPVVPLAPRQALGIAAMSYHGQVGFGLLGDLDAMADLDELTADLDGAVGALADVAGVRRPRRTAGAPARGRGRGRLRPAPAPAGRT